MINRVALCRMWRRLEPVRFKGNRPSPFFTKKAVRRTALSWCAISLVIVMYARAYPYQQECVVHNVRKAKKMEQLDSKEMCLHLSYD